jgi:hypothetical protein
MPENAGAADLDLTDALAEIEQLIPLGPAFGRGGGTGAR